MMAVTKQSVLKEVKSPPSPRKQTFLLIAAGDVSRGGTSATQPKKFHTDDIKSVLNPFISADWTTE